MAWLSDWAYRREITVDNTNIDSDLTHFPVPIVLGTSVGQSNQDLSKVFDELGASSKKIAITKSDGTTQLYGEVEQWDNGNEKALIWVSKSDLTLTSASTTTLYLYYDSSKADNTTYIGNPGSRTEVWAAAANYLLSETSGTTIKDSLGNADGTISGVYTLDQAGLLGRGINFSDASVSVPNLPSLGDQAAWTVVAVCKTTHDYNMDILHAEAARNESRIALVENTGSYVCYREGFNDGSHANRIEFQPRNHLTDGNWHVVVYSYDGTDLTVFIGYNDAVTNAADNFDSNSGTPTLFDRQTDEFHYQGDCCLLSLYMTALSVDWVKAFDYAQADNLLTFGAGEGAAPAAPAACVFDEADPYDVATYTPSDLFGDCGGTCATFDEADPYEVSGYTADPYGDCV